MSGRNLFTCFLCVAILDPFIWTDGRPAAGLPVPENTKLPGTGVSKEDLITLAQYAMRMMASKINITLQATASHTNFPRYADLAQIKYQSTTPTIIASTYYETLGNIKQTSEKSLTPRKAFEETEKPRSSLPEKTSHKDPAKGINREDKPLITSERPSVVVEKFVRYPDKGVVDHFPTEFDFELIPNSKLSTTYLPQAEKSSAFLTTPVHQGLNNAFVPSVLPLTSSNEEEELRGPSIRLRNLTVERVPGSSKQESGAVMSVPFEAIITFTRQKPSVSSNLEPEDNKNIVVIPTRDPPDDFPPYFETVLSVGKKTNDPKNSLLNFELHDKNLNPVVDSVNNKVTVKPMKSTKPMNKRQTQRLGDLLEMLGASTKRSKGNRRGSSSITQTTSTPTVTATASKITKAQKSSSVKLPESTTTPPKRGGPMFQRQEIEEDEEEEEEGGSLGSIADLLPLVLPILEDLSDPNTETDIAELLEAGLPLVQGISQGDGEEPPPDFVGILSPVISSLSAPNRNGNGTVFQTILPLILPLVSPFIGSIVGPIIQGLSNPADPGGSSIIPLIQALAGPLSLPTEPGGVSIASSLISGIIAGLSKDLKSGAAGGSDVNALVSTLVSGVIAGGSTGISTGLNAKLMKPPPAAHRPVNNGYGAYGQGPVPASSVDTFELVGTSLKDILGLSLQLVKSVIASVTGILGASSMEQPRPVYGPANAYSRIT